MQNKKQKRIASVCLPKLISEHKPVQTSFVSRSNIKKCNTDKVTQIQDRPFGFTAFTPWNELTLLTGNLKWYKNFKKIYEEPVLIILKTAESCSSSTSSNYFKLINLYFPYGIFSMMSQLYHILCIHLE